MPVLRGVVADLARLATVDRNMTAQVDWSKKTGDASVGISDQEGIDCGPRRWREQRLRDSGHHAVALVTPGQRRRRQRRFGGSGE